MNRFFTFRSLLAVVAVAAVIQGSASAACWYPDEIVADQVKDFQYMLMVGALQCRNSAASGNEAYNAFVTQQRNVLDSKGYVLKGHFLRENGVTGGRAAYDQYNTAMSNRHAGRMDDPSFCQTIAVYTRMAAGASDRDFVTLAQAVIEAPVSSCATAGYVAPAAVLPPVVRRPEPLPVAAVVTATADDPYAGEIVAEPRVERPVVAMAASLPAEPGVPLPAEAAVPVAAPVAYAPMTMPAAVAAPLPAAVAAPLPAPVLAPAAARAPLPMARTAAALPVTAIAAAPVIPPEEAKAAAPSPAAALQAAIVALQAAADALRAQSGPTS